jgi:hypothetical protein
VAQSAEHVAERLQRRFVFIRDKDGEIRLVAGTY